MDNKVPYVRVLPILDQKWGDTACLVLLLSQKTLRASHLTICQLPIAYLSERKQTVRKVCNIFSLHNNNCHCRQKQRQLEVGSTSLFLFAKMCRFNKEQFLFEFHKNKQQNGLFRMVLLSGFRFRSQVSVHSSIAEIY